MNHPEHIKNHDDKLRQIGIGKTVLVYAGLASFFYVTAAQLWLLGIVFFVMLVVVGLALKRMEKRVLRDHYGKKPYEFWIYEYHQPSDLHKTLAVSVFVFCIVLVVVLTKYTSSDVFPFVMASLPLMYYYYESFYLRIGKKLHFNEEMILRVDIYSQVIRWSDVIEIKRNPDDKFYEIVLKDKDSIRIGTERYYTRGMQPEKILIYISKQAGLSEGSIVQSSNRLIVKSSNRQIVKSSNRLTV